MLSDKYDFSGCKDRLRQVIKEKKLTQNKAASLLGISQSSLTLYLKGRIPSHAALFKMSKLFGKPMEWFLTGQDDIKDNIP